MRLPNPAVLTARAIHAVVAAYQAIDAPPPGPAWQEATCVQAATQVNTSEPGRAYRDARVTRPYAHGVGFTGDPR